MHIQLYDRGSPQGKKLFSDLQSLSKRLQIDYDPEYVQDMSRVYNMGIQGKSVLLIDGEVVFVDRYPKPQELETIITEYL